MKISIIAGARPNFMKIAPIIDAINHVARQGKDIKFRLIHTGQHYDKKMSDSFFEQLGIPQPDVNLGAGGGTQAEQTAAIMVGFEKDLIQYPADVVLVVGDVTSTMACAIVAKKLNTTVAHVEAGIRSFDLTMPEEINRMVTDSITDYFFTTSEFANANLLRNGAHQSSIYFVGNTMIDTLLKNKSKFICPPVWQQAKLVNKGYFVLTLHRPANVDQENTLKTLMAKIIEQSNGMPIIFPVHPRTAKNLQAIGINAPNVYFIDPLSYLEFNYLVQHAKLVITDSGGITEETTVLGVPCVTLRDNTERPETIAIGTNELIGTDPEAIVPAFEKLYSGTWKKGGIPPLWDGQAATRIVAHLLEIASENSN
jgi:UDP-N-acetylglucosamine 2-epimerase (non-hydrolysing)